MNRVHIDIHTDGCCLGNPGVGGWAAILVHPAKELVLRGSDCDPTTNNRMELTAVIEAAKVLKKPCDITVHTDSTYVMMTTNKWLAWQRKSEIKNKDLWLELIDVLNAGGHKIRYEKVKGHSGEVYNERCDTIAKEQAHKAKLLYQVRQEQIIKERTAKDPEAFADAVWG